MLQVKRAVSIGVVPIPVATIAIANARILIFVVDSILYHVEFNFYHVSTSTSIPFSWFRRVFIMKMIR